jgi:hypothetical protein
MRKYTMETSKATDKPKVYLLLSFNTSYEDEYEK